MVFFDRVPIPKAVKDEERLLETFVRYISQRLVMDAILNLTKDKKTKNLVWTASRQLTGYGRELRELIRYAPALKMIADLARRLGNPTLLPEAAIPSQACVDACLQAHHVWMRDGPE